MEKWVLPTLSEVLAQGEEPGVENIMSHLRQTMDLDNGIRRCHSRIARDRVKAEREWCGAIAALEQILLQTISIDRPERENLPHTYQGLVLAGPVPVLSHPTLMTNLRTGIFTVEQFNPLALMPSQSPAATDGKTEIVPPCPHSLPLLAADPLAREQFCVVFTAKFCLAMVLGEDENCHPAFMFSFEPEVVEKAWLALRSRLLLTSGQFPLAQLDALVEQYAPVIPDYRIVMQFSRQILKHLPEESKRTETEVRKGAMPHSPPKLQNPRSNDVELLQAFAHEVRTPLTTIRTLTKLLLKRRDLAPDVTKRLEIIDHECSEQINRMELIFRAVELETSEIKRSPVHLTATSLVEMLQQSIPRWQKQASRRNLTLDVVLPQKLPAVVSNPLMLDQVLTGLIENFTRNLPSGGHIQVEITTAGDQLKLQLQSQNHAEENSDCVASDNKVKSIGQLLIFQPETGNISLNLNVTKNLFHALGGKLIVRQRPQQGEVMTIFLPLEVGSKHIWDI